MKKVGIITLNSYGNYGNRLQNYALQEVLKSLGFYVETIVIDNCRNVETNKNNNILKKVKGKSAIEVLGMVYFKLFKANKNLRNEKYILERIDRLINFTHTYILETDFTISNNRIPEDLSNRYDYFVTGSDQVWNPNFNEGSSIYFLSFAPKNKRIAYSASFGICTLPVKFLDCYKSWINEMVSLSVREEAGAEIIKNLTGRDCVVLLDPTLLLAKEDWLLISKQSSNKPKNKYLLTYFLDEVSKINRIKINNIAFKNKLEVINLADINDLSIYTADPSEFIDFINSSTVFFTDSFHGCVFSILLEKSFVVFERSGKIPSMNSRLNTLLSKFNMESRKWKKVKENKNFFNTDFSHISPILKTERKKAMEYLENALNIKDSK